jgi:hypothetical protein
MHAAVAAYVHCLADSFKAAGIVVNLSNEIKKYLIQIKRSVQSCQQLQGSNAKILQQCCLA